MGQMPYARYESGSTTREDELIYSGERTYYMWMTTGFYVSSRNGIKQITTRKIKDYMKRCINKRRKGGNKRKRRA